MIEPPAGELRTTLSANQQLSAAWSHSAAGAELSPAPDGPYGIADLGGDLLGLLDDLEIERASVCGLSLGAMVAMWSPPTLPDRIDRLVLCATSARLGPPEMWAARAGTVLDKGVGAVADLVVGRWFTPGYAAEHPEVVDRMRAMIASCSAVGYAGCCRAWSAGWT